MPDPGTRDFETSRSGARQDADFAAPIGDANDGGISGGGAENSGVTQQAGNMARNLGEQARSAMADPGATAQELARRAREQASHGAVQVKGPHQVSIDKPPVASASQV